MKRREAIDARKAGREPCRLHESDFLPGVHDLQRLGGLRFKELMDGPFLSAQDGIPVPPWARLHEIENAAWNIQSNDSHPEDEVSQWIRLPTVRACT
jgi:serine/threonine-protein kinase HipA